MNQLTGRLGNIDIDLNRGVLLFPVKIVTTIGLSQEVHDKFRWIGAIISALIAAGVAKWLFGFISFGRRH